MKLIRCNGRVMEVRRVSEVILELRATTVPLKPCGWTIVDDDEYRARARDTIASGLYERVI